MDLFVVPKISFRLLYGLLILRHDRRQILWLGATAHPTAEWIARQLTEAYGWERAPEYLCLSKIRSGRIGDAFCQGDRGEVGQSRMPIARTRQVNTSL